MQGSPRLLVRVDDAGSSLAANEGCERAVRDGIARSVEVMVPGAWVHDAAERFRRLPDADIGIHMTLASEWDRVKWRPLTHAPSLTDTQGFFLPLLKARPGDARPSLETSPWDMAEIEAELRAQIALGLTLFPQASHISTHMFRHLDDVDPRLGRLARALASEFGLLDDPLGTDALPRIVGYPPFPRDVEPRVRSFLDMVSGLADGPSLFLDHPAVLSDELRAHGHAGYEDVAEDRASCLEVLTDPRVKRLIDDKGVALISYRDLA